MGDILNELKIINQRLCDLESQGKESREKILQLDKKFESLGKKTYDNPSELSGQENNTFQHFSVPSLSLDIQQSDVSLKDLHTTEPKGKLAT